MLRLLLDRKVSPYQLGKRHEVTGTNIAITSLHLLLTARLEHVRREPNICYSAPLQIANRRPAGV